MPQVDLSDTEWQQVMAILSTAPWRDANPLLMKIGRQLQERQTSATMADMLRAQVAGNGKEATDE